MIEVSIHDRSQDSVDQKGYVLKISSIWTFDVFNQSFSMLESNFNEKKISFFGTQDML